MYDQILRALEQNSPLVTLKMCENDHKRVSLHQDSFDLISEMRSKSEHRFSWQKKPRQWI